MSDKPQIDHGDAAVAAGYVFALYRLVRWDVRRGDRPEDIDLYNRSLAKCRELWPWLDYAADTVEANVKENR